MMAVSGCCGLVAFLSSAWGAEIAATLPLVLVLPGASLVLASDSRSARLLSSEGLLWSLLGSLAIAIGGGLILNVVSALNKTTWLAFLLAVIASGCAVSMSRRGDSDRSTWRWAEIRSGRFRFSPRSAALSGAALLLAAGAVSLSLYSSAKSDQEHFVQLWILPTPRGGGATATRADIGLTNREGLRDQFEITIDETGSGPLRHKEVSLAEGQTWTYKLSRKTSVPVSVRVALAAQPSRILASVRLASPVR